MELALIVLKQTMVMGIYLLIGFALSRLKIIDEKGTKVLSSLVLLVILPVTVFNNFRMEFSQEKIIFLLESFALAILAIGIAMLISTLFFKKKPIYNLSSSFSNAGFIGLPLVRATFGDDAGFFVVGIMALINIAQWIYSAVLFTNGKVDKKKILKNPMIISVILGLIVFFTKLGDKFPPILDSAINGLTAMNSPLAMILLGLYFGQSDLRKLFTVWDTYYVSLVRLIVIPIVTMLAFYFIPVDLTLKTSVLIAASAAVGMNTAAYADMFNQDYTQACQIVVLSTLMTIVTLPLLIALNGILP